MVTNWVRTMGAAIAAVAVIGSLALSGQAAAATRSCHAVGGYQSIVASGVTCARAGAVLKDLSTNFSARVHLGFRCTMGSKPNAKGLYPGACKSGTRRITYAIHPS
jgi:hypothetical protein